MHLKFNNVNDAFEGLVRGIHDKSIPTVEEDSRNGPVIRIPERVMVTYREPTKRVLFNKARDANPFFHLYEALWMLAGRNDVASLVYYNSNMANYSDDGEVFNGAYGYRWKHTDTFNKQCVSLSAARTEADQLPIIIEHLKNNPYSRRAVLNMWNVQDDLLNIGHPVEYSKDVCCNLNVVFSVRKAEDLFEDDPMKKARPIDKTMYLDMDVYNRSNDLIWGMLGANYVHFSFLQEYMACMLGVKVGEYTQITSNLHVYKDNWYPEMWLESHKNMLRRDCYGDSYQHVPLIVHGHRLNFDNEVSRFVEAHKDSEVMMYWDIPFIGNVAFPMCRAFQEHKKRSYPLAEYWLDKVQAEDWREAGLNWIGKREKNYLDKTITQAYGAEE